MAANPFERIIRHYNRYHRRRIEDEESWFRSHATSREAISRTALARGRGGKKLDHQWRLKNSDLLHAEAALLDVEREIVGSETFDELFCVVWGAVRHIWKNPELDCYDTSQRIGLRLGLKPQKVYLHRGTRIGAQRLGLNTKGATIELSAPPEGLRGIDASSIEDILCIYKDDF